MAGHEASLDVCLIAEASSQTVLFLRLGIRHYSDRPSTLPPNDNPCFPFLLEPQFGSEAMDARQEKLVIEVLPPTGREASFEAADQAVRALARIIGRQIAREEFQRAVAREQKAQTSSHATRSADKSP
ncbi:hypothetical protein ACFQXB_18880 [Plastorhodobacter daqingensis]|uniref:Uncharacterized protein n=1 Tax=Plastorhodobacter daqingensis TaxID=1387281 RepID=A0ABW2UN61_9RHOB